MAEIKIYTKSTCPACDMAKKILSEKGAEYTELCMDDKPEELNQLKARTGLQTVPQIFINGEMIGGCSDLMKLDEDKKLDPMLQIQPE
ncbi:MAG: glutaredoxin 3 [Bdellovibrionales bacterium]|nr:glutaredoxin 3 [Bdellovibrionales bacterium]